MFDIGLWEMAVIAVVALVVVGPEEFPTMVRTTTAWLGKMRRFVSDVRSDLSDELKKIEELKEMVAKEVDVAALHEKIDLTEPAVKRPTASEKSTATEIGVDNDTTDKPAEQAAADVLGGDRPDAKQP